MPIPPAPFTLECQHCHWRKTIALSSDVIFPGEIPGHCARCGSNRLEHKKATFLAAQIALLKRQLLL